MLLTVSGNQAPGNHRGQPGTGSPPQLACWLIPHRLAAERPLAIQICPVGRQQQPGFPMLAITRQQLHAQTSQLGSSQSRCRPVTLSTMTPDRRDRLDDELLTEQQLAARRNAAAKRQSDMRLRSACSASFLLRSGAHSRTKQWGDTQPSCFTCSRW